MFFWFGTGKLAHSGGGPKRDGISASKGLLKEWPEAGPKLAWITEGVGGGYASVSIADAKSLRLAI